jgi:hypothetical protein
MLTVKGRTISARPTLPRIFWIEGREISLSPGRTIMKFMREVSMPRRMLAPNPWLVGWWMTRTLGSPGRDLIGDRNR